MVRACTAVAALCCNFWTPGALSVPASEEATLTVHVFPHSHLDVGYKKTFEGYWKSEVHTVINSVVQALQADPSRRFLWSEVAWLERWFGPEASDVDRAVQEQFRSLVDNGQIEMVDGGWSQHDDQLATIEQQLQNMRTGLQWLKRNNFPLPRVGWHPDTFCASSSLPTLYSLAGYDAMVYNRMNDEVKSGLESNRSMEFIWRGSGTLGEKGELLLHALNTHTGYESPDCYDWEPDQNPCPAVTDENIAALSDAYMSDMSQRSKGFRHGHVLVAFGGDFRFRDAESQYRNMDKILDYVNANPSRYAELLGRPARIQYSTFKEYFAAVASEDVTFPVRSGSVLLPFYMDGYFSGYPHLKQAYARAGEMLADSEAFAALAQLRSGREAPHAVLQAAREHLALLSHHDGLPAAGTGFYFRDSMRRIAAADHLAHRALDASVSALAEVGGSGLRLLPSRGEAIAGVAGDGALARPRQSDAWLCPSMGSPSKAVVLNPSATAGPRFVELWVCMAEVVVRDSQNNTLPAQADRDTSNDGSFLLRVGPVALPAFGFETLEISQAWDTTNTDPPFDPLPAGAAQRSEEEGFESCADAAAGSIENEFMRVQFSKSDGIVSIESLAAGGDVLGFSHTFAIYTGKGSNVYSLKPPEPARELKVLDWQWSAQKGTVAETVTLTPRGLSLPDGPGPYNLSAADAQIGSIILRLRQGDPHLELQYSEVSLRRGCNNNGVQLVARFAVEGCSGAPAWTLWENGYEPVEIATASDASSVFQIHRGLSSALEVPCSSGRRLQLLGTEGHGAAVAADFAEVMLHRRLPQLPSPDSPFEKGDDASVIETSLRLGLVSAGSPKTSAAAAVSRWLSAPRVFAASSTWDFEGPPDAVGVPTLEGLALPAGARVLHLAVDPASRDSSLAAVFLTLRHVGEETVLVPLASFSGARVVSVHELGIGLDRTAEEVAGRRRWNTSDAPGQVTSCLVDGSPPAARLSNLTSICSFSLQLDTAKGEGSTFV